MCDECPFLRNHLTHPSRDYHRSYSVGEHHFVVLKQLIIYWCEDQRDTDSQEHEADLDSAIGDSGYAFHEGSIAYECHVYEAVFDTIG